MRYIIVMYIIVMYLFILVAVWHVTGQEVEFAVDF